MINKISLNDFIEVLEIIKKRLNINPVPLKVSNNDPFKVLVSTILSARTKDEVTEQVSKKLFSIVNTPEEILNLPIEELEKLIYPVGFYRSKAKKLKELCRILIEKYNSQVPNSKEELLKLPGVGSKTANLVLSLGFGKKEVSVDTHVHRIVNRWDLVDTSTPQETEKALRDIVPEEYLPEINSVLVEFGKNICRPIPKCEKCFEEIKNKCPYYKRILLFNKILEKYSFEKISPLKIPKEKGTYILKIYLNRKRTIKYGNNKRKFLKGYYFYVGSAFGNSVNLYTRINRHLSSNKKFHWHIDNLLVYGKIKEIYVSKNNKVECNVAKDLQKILFPIPKFGSTDCKCFSHLFFIKQ